MRKPFVKIERHLVKLLDRELMAEIHSFRSDRLSKIAAIIEQMSDAIAEASGAEAFKNAIVQGIEGIQDFLNDSDQEDLRNRLISNIFVLKNEFPKRIVFEQLPERFQNEENDSPYVKAGKAGKRFLRMLGKSEWMQKVPAQHVVGYHLLEADWFFKDWLSAEERLIMQIILELDQVLANAARGNLEQGNDAELRQLLQVVHNYIEEAQQAQEQELAEARNMLIDRIIEVFPKVDTFERPHALYSEKKLLERKEQTQESLQNYQREWSQINGQLIKRTAALYRFILFCEDLKQATSSFEADIRELFDHIFLMTFDKIEGKITAVRQDILSSKQELFSILTDQNNTLQINLNSQLLQPLHKSIEQEEFKRRVDSYETELKERVGELSETAVFVTELNRNEDPPEIKAKEIPWQPLVKRAMNERLVKEITPLAEQMREFANEQLEEMQELNNFIEVNLESAIDLVRDPSATDDPYEVADSALKRGRLRVEESKTEARDMLSALLEPLHEKIDVFRHLIFNLLHEADTKKLQIWDAQQKVTEKTEGWQAQFKTGWSRVQNRGAVITRYLRTQTGRIYEDANIRLGFKKETEPPAAKADVAAYLSETERQIDELPYIYRHLFNFKSLADDQYYVGLNENFNYTREIYEHWKQGMPTSLAVIGEKGSGKSTYLQLVDKELFANEQVLRIDLAHTLWTEKEFLQLFADKLGDTVFSTVDELVSFLTEGDKRRVIIFEGIQNAYIRNLNGYEAIEKLIYLTSETGNRVFWLISCSRHAWTYLDEAFSIGAYFSHQIQTDMLNAKQIEKAIMKRHRASGYELVFAASERDAKNKTYKKLLQDQKKEQEYLKDNYFTELSNISSGNVSIAMIFWIRSIQKFDDSRCYIAFPETASLEMLEEFSPRMLFVLAALVLHDRLKPEELARALNMSLQESRMVMNRLTGKGITQNSEQGFEINQLMYRQVIEKLKELNILHLG